MDLKFKITASCFGSQEILTAPHMTYRSQSSYQCLSVKSPEKNSALVISFVPFKNFAVAWMDVVRVFFRHVVGLLTLYLPHQGLRHARDHVPLSSKPSTVYSLM